MKINGCADGPFPLYVISVPLFLRQKGGMYIIYVYYFIDLIIFTTFITNRVRKKALNYHWSLFTTRHA